MFTDLSDQIGEYKQIGTVSGAHTSTAAQQSPFVFSYRYQPPKDA